MPNRILREGILTSERVARLGLGREEVFYRRLMSVVDDFGRYYANPTLLRAALFPLHLDQVSDADISAWLQTCIGADLVRAYPAADGKKYLELLDFKQQVRARTSRFPAFDPELASQASDPATAESSTGGKSDAPQVRSMCSASAHLDVSVDGDVFGDGGGDGKPPIPPKGGRKGPTSLKAWIEAVRAKGEKVIPDDDPIVAYADRVGLPNEFLRLGWREFKRSYIARPEKRYSDWRRTFRTAVERGYLKLWYIDKTSGQYALTTAGLQAKRDAESSGDAP